MSDESKTENEETETEAVEPEAENAATEETAEEPKEETAAEPKEETSKEPKDESKAKATTSDDLARMLGVVTEDDPDLEDSIRAVSQDVTTDANTLEQEMARRKSNRTATIVFFTCFALFLGFIGLMWFQHGDQFAAFFGGNIEEHKMKDRIDQEKKWREIEALQTNNYGSTELTYSPGDAKVTIKMLKFVEDETAFIDRMKKNVDKRTAPKVTCIIDNQSMHLKENQKIRKLSFPTLPIQERLADAAEHDKFISACVCTNDVQCGEGMFCGKAKPEWESKSCIPKPVEKTEEDEADAPKRKKTDKSISMASYRYEVEIAKEGYERRRYFFSSAAVSGLDEDVELLTWEKIGPGVFVLNFSGADLVMDPETAKELVQKARIDMKCEMPKVKDEAEQFALKQQIQIRHNFQTNEEWDKITAKLQEEHAEWWAELEKELPKFKCP